MSEDGVLVVIKSHHLNSQRSLGRKATANITPAMRHPFRSSTIAAWVRLPAAWVENAVGNVRRHPIGRMPPRAGVPASSAPPPPPAQTTRLSCLLWHSRRHYGYFIVNGSVVGHIVLRSGSYCILGNIDVK